MPLRLRGHLGQSLRPEALGGSPEACDGGLGASGLTTGCGLRCPSIAKHGEGTERAVQNTQKPSLPEKKEIAVNYVIT